MTACKSIGCFHEAIEQDDFCPICRANEFKDINLNTSLASIYPQYYKDIGELTVLDVYAVHHLFEIDDPSGCIQHASKKLLLSGVRTGGKSTFKDIKEARDTLTRWLELNPGC